MGDLRIALLQSRHGFLDEAEVRLALDGALEQAVPATVVRTRVASQDRAGGNHA